MAKHSGAGEVKEHSSFSKLFMATCLYSEKKQTCDM